jgi:predicted TPR repeat methyltransferase
MKEKLLKIEAWITQLPQKIKDFYNYALEELKVMSIKCANLSETNYELGLFHAEKGNVSDAKMRFILVTKLKPEFALAHYHLARCYMFDSRFVKARQELEVSLSLDPSLECAKYRLKQLTHSISDDPILLEVVKEDYNLGADRYEDQMLNQQGYKAPELLAKAVAQALFDGFRKESYECLDLGCGTGMAGVCLTQEVVIKSLTGIDISSRMLELAKTVEIDNKPVYSEVKEQGFNNLELGKRRFDIIIACMSLGYSNDIDTLFATIEKLTLISSVLGLVVLKSEVKDIEFDYSNSCWKFSERFLQLIFQKFNWSVAYKKETALFLNATSGYIFVLKKNDEINS